MRRPAVNFTQSARCTGASFPFEHRRPGIAISREASASARRRSRRPASRRRRRQRIRRRRRISGRRLLAEVLLRGEQDIRGWIEHAPHELQHVGVGFRVAAPARAGAARTRRQIEDTRARRTRRKAPPRRNGGFPPWWRSCFALSMYQPQFLPSIRHAITRDVTDNAVPPSMKPITTMSQAGRWL